MRTILLLVLVSLAGCSFSKNVDDTSAGLVKATVVTQQSHTPSSIQADIFHLLAISDYHQIESWFENNQVNDFKFVNADGETPADILMKLNDIKKIVIFRKYGMSLYDVSKEHLEELIQEDTLKVADYLDRYYLALARLPLSASADNLFYKFHRKETLQVLSLIDDERYSEAIGFLKNQRMTCNQAGRSIILFSQSLVNRIKTDRIVNFFKQSRCDESFSSQEVKKLYELEMRRQFQDRFSDVSLLFMLASNKNLRSKMVSFGLDNLKLGPYFLAYIARDCGITKGSFWNFDGDLFIHRSCLPPKDAIGGISAPELKKCTGVNFTKDCFSSIGFPMTDFDMSLSFDNRRLFATKDYVISEEDRRSGRLTTYIEGLAYGFKNNEDDLKAEFSEFFDIKPWYFESEKD